MTTTYQSGPTGHADSIEHIATVHDFETIRRCRYQWCKGHRLHPERAEFVPDDCEPTDPDGWQWTENRRTRQRSHIVEAPSHCFALQVWEWWEPETAEHRISDVSVDSDLAHCYSARDVQDLSDELVELARIAQTVTLP